MRSLAETRNALTFLATLSVAGCGGGEVAHPNPPQQFASSGGPKSTESQLSGGAFSANYSGRWRLQHSWVGDEFVFDGQGTASFIGKSGEAGSLGPPEMFGIVTLASDSKHRNTIAMGLPSVNLCGHHSTFYVHGGTGKFRNATGGGTLNFICHRHPRAYTDSWTGTLYYGARE